ncbi:Terminal uridylyltransferase cid1 [Ceratocystis fimbriata CBS 114723]|uniref:polynucleotide adenylyltransferase n=1 Tax=Ceratocystis fimbriata CBS 114723 TaxID=1035309 RepID=A0A2C5XI97_9PEZI|nr:Terminal uridylyltransferase cid1 [Ceratocystis fimbriata CBS 114723]
MSSSDRMANRPVQSSVDRLGNHFQNMAVGSPSQNCGLAANGAIQGSSAFSPAGVTSPKATRRRMNQAQRRNMSSQLVIPIDPRAQQSPSGPSRPQAHNHHPEQRHSEQTRGGQQWVQPPTNGGPPHHHNHSLGFNGQNSPRWQHHNRQGYYQNHQYNQHLNNQHNNQQYHQPNRTNPHNANHYNRNGYSHNIHGQDHHSNHHFAPSHRFNGSAGDFHHGGSYHASNSRQSVQGWSGASGQSRIQMDKSFAYLDSISREVLEDCEVSSEDLASKNQFRETLEAVCREAVSKFEKEVNKNLDFRPESVQLRCFGSIASGFATKGSDMDLGLVTPQSKQQPDNRSSPIPRLIEKAFLDLGYGARLLTRTRVPIIKLCEKPSSQLLEELLKERECWEKGLSNDDEDLSRSDEQSTVLNRDGAAAISPPLSSGKEVQAVTTEEIEITESGLNLVDGPHLFVLSGRISICQQHNQNLSSYFTTCKKLLLQLDIPDLEEDTYRSLTPTTILTINKVCYAFIQGLCDPDLKRRVMSLPSNRFASEEMEFSLPLKDAPVSIPTACHSIMTTFLQMDAEDILQRWDDRPKGLLDVHNEQECLVVASELQHSLEQETLTAEDVILYARNINNALARFKQLSVVQVTGMEQRPNEPPMDYYSRSNRLFRSFSPGRGNASEQMTQFFLYYFIRGVYKPEFREVLEEFNGIEEPLKSPTLADLSLKLMALQLAADFELAREKGIYTEEQNKTVVEYVEILRRPLSRLPTAGARAWYKYALSMQPEEKQLIERIKVIGDPALISQSRERYRDELEFPKEGVGAQCDVNFSAHLALQNSTLLRCYSHTDARVRQMVLFIKRWAKMRQINTPYRGSLSSYGYVLMVLHFLVNIAEPFVCPNLQKSAPPKSAYSSEQYSEMVECQGYDVRFMRDEEALIAACKQKAITANTDSLGALLCGFFEYYAHSGPMLTIPGKRGFDWGCEVLSLRTFQGGILTKQAKNWTGAKTVFMVESGSSFTGPGSPPRLTSAKADISTNLGSNASPEKAFKLDTSAAEKKNEASRTDMAEISLKEVRCRYLFAIEDPFEIDHNVARTVTHHGISSIRDEFRRAWRLIQGAQNGMPTEALIEPVSLVSLQDKNFFSLLETLHAH